MASLDQVLADIDETLPQSLERLAKLLSFPSVGTDPAFAGDCRKAADWLRSELQAIGFETSLRPSTGQPIVIAKHAPEGLPAHAPHILFYGHYDVQPADPVELWDSPPFEAHIRKGANGQDAIFARGASDDKGQLMTFVEARRAWIKAYGKLPFRMTILLEGDEEGDSTHLDRFLAENRTELKADAAFVCDTELWQSKRPAICTRLRGCLCEEMTITGPKLDLHSGYYGGPAVNPIKVLSRILDAMHDKQGRITIPGFMDGVVNASAVQRREWAKLKFSGRHYLEDVGLSVPAGEKAYTPLEQMWMRPTVEINGIWGGYRGPGFKTVLPSQASAKLSFRLVEGQKPARVRKAFRDFVKARLPKDCKVSFLSQGGDSIGIAIASDSPWIRAARKALHDEWKREPVLIGSGGSIPVVESFRRHLGIDAVLVGFAKDDDAVHSPNEKYDVDSYHKGTRSWARIISALSDGVRNA